MKFYIATALANRDLAVRLDGLLTRMGHEATFAWWHRESIGRPHGRPLMEINEAGALALEREAQAEEEEVAYMTTLKQRAHDDLDGVINANHLIVILPGGRGTHVELGTALALARVHYARPWSGCGTAVGPTPQSMTACSTTRTECGTSLAR